MIGLSEIDAAAVAAARERVPRAFGRPPVERAWRLAAWAVFAGLVAYCLVAFDVTFERLWIGITRLGWVLGFFFPPYVWPSWAAFMEPVYAIAETLAMAFLGTLIGSLLAFPLGFLGAANINRVLPLRFGLRRGFDFMRALEQLILALVFIRAFGLGPLAGIFAIAISDMGSLAKLFAEAIENVDRKPIEGVRAAGGGRLQVIRYGYLPQVLPVLLSTVLYFFESNTRTATILGIVGAGGIGYFLYDRIGANRWDEVLSIIVLILVTVMAIDALSRRLRMAVIGRRG